MKDKFLDGRFRPCAALESRKMPPGDKRINELVSRYDVPPALIDTAVRSAELQELDGGIEKTIECIEEAMELNIEQFHIMWQLYGLKFR